ncbi:12034_t:CDS:2 [Ambispora gerdemannii]|uniref:sphingomyelin phosphodiesterase n=1 Tax=Ambispora gerdemannii TaxID=144530 RepID=A0A9N9BHZ3_9GLOM|nr:12034_t:CDS:2 [Ambispora gerdemannii]
MESNEEISVWAESLITPNSDQNSKVEGVRILTFNFFMRPPLIRNNASDYKEARLEYFIQNILSNYDIICLQEMFQFGSSRRNRLLEAAFKKGFKFSWTSPAKSILSGSIDGGLVLLSKFPLHEREITVYPIGCYSDRFSDKGALYAKIAITNNDCIHLFTTHTQASYSSAPPPNEESVIIRHQQLALLRKFIDKCLDAAGRKPEELVLLVGDLNANGRPQLDPLNPAIVQEDSAEYKCMTRILRGEGIEASLANPKLIDLEELCYVAPTVINIRDIARERYGQHPVTFGDVYVDDKGYIHPRETVLTSTKDWKTTASLDYVLIIDEKDDELTVSKRTVEVDVQKTKIEEFFISTETSNHPFTQLSDHYGVSTVLKVKDGKLTPYTV